MEIILPGGFSTSNQAPPGTPQDMTPTDVPRAACSPPRRRPDKIVAASKAPASPTTVMSAPRCPFVEADCHLLDSSLPPSTPSTSEVMLAHVVVVFAITLAVLTLAFGSSEVGTAR